MISPSRACELNSEQIQRLRGLHTDNLDMCKVTCLSHNKCHAIDWYRAHKWCNLFERACKQPQEAKDGASSHYLLPETKQCTRPGSGHGMMGILGNADEYVCNAVQTVLGHLANASNVTFLAALVPKSDGRFWHPANKAKTRNLRPPTQNNSAIKQLSARGDVGVKERPSRRYSNKPVNTSRRHVPGDSGDSGPEGDNRPTAKNYLIPAHARPGKRCASAKHDLGDDLLAIAVVVPIGPFDFDKRTYLRRFLSAPAHALRSRRWFREIRSSSAPKRQPLFEYFIPRTSWLSPLKDIKHIQYTEYQWGWHETVLAAPTEDPRAVCVEVLFAVS